MNRKSLSKLVSVTIILLVLAACGPAMMPMTTTGTASTTLSVQQNDDVEGVVAALYDALNNGDVDAQLALYAEDAVVTAGPLGTHVGSGEIRGLLEQQVAAHAYVEYEILTVEDGTITTESSYTSDEYSVALDITEVFQVQDGVVESHEWIPSEEAQKSMDVWWPSAWGPDDEVGATNRITPDTVLAATELIETGQVYELGREYGPNMPVFGTRVFTLRTLPPAGPFGENGLIYHDEYVATELGQVGTQLDAIGHIGIQLGNDGDATQMYFYNGFTEHEIGGMYGLQKLGVQNTMPIFTRGILIDVVGLKGRMLEGGEEITMADVQDALERQGMTEADIQSGSVILFHTGWGSLWQVDNERYVAAMPGIGLEVAHWLIEKEVVLVGSDTLVVEVVPNPDPALAFPVHSELITKNGIHLHENLDLSTLAEDEVYQFAYIFVRVPLVGGTGSPGSPIAVR